MPFPIVWMVRFNVHITVKLRRIDEPRVHNGIVETNVPLLGTHRHEGIAFFVIAPEKSALRLNGGCALHAIDKKGNGRANGTLAVVFGIQPVSRGCESCASPTDN